MRVYGSKQAEPALSIRPIGFLMMNRTEVLELLAQGESPRVAFGRDGVRPEKLGRDLAAMLNSGGGKILLGVADDGSVAGLARSRQDTERWVLDSVRENVRPPFIPDLEFIALDGRMVGVVGAPADGPDRPYKAREETAWGTFMRVGGTSRAASRQEEGRLYQSSPIVRHDLRAIPGSGLEDLDRRRLANYFGVVLGRPVPAVEDREGWLRLLADADLLKRSGSSAAATLAGLLLFGAEPGRWLRHAGIAATAYPGPEKERGAAAEEEIREPLVSVFSGADGDRRRVVAKGSIDRAVDFVFRNMASAARPRGARRSRREKSLPLAAVREAIINAVAHRDYVWANADIELSLYPDRLEVISPGRLPDGVAMEQVKRGARTARNGKLKDVLCAYGYMSHRGLGVPCAIVKAMRAHNGTEPDLLEDGDRFIVRLWKAPRPARAAKPLPEPALAGRGDLPCVKK